MKNIVLPHSEIILKSLKLDINGNKTLTIEYRGRKLKVQTNGNLPFTHSVSLDSSLDDDSLIKIRKEVVNWFFEVHGLNLSIKIIN